MKRSGLATLLLLVAIFGSVTSSLSADTVHLANGDVLHGKVLWLNDQRMQLESEIYGDLLIKREKVVTIILGHLEPATVSPDQAKRGMAPTRPAESGKPATPLSVDDIVKQLQTGGIDPQTLGDVQKAVPLVTAPEVQKYLTDSLTGLMSGSLNVQDIRKDAINARDQVEDLKKSLGPQAGAALDGYLSILNRFINETAPKDARAKQDTNPSAPAPSPEP